MHLLRDLKTGTAANERAQLPVRAVQPPGGVRGVRCGHQGGVSAVPFVLQRADRPGEECGGERRGGLVVRSKKCLLAAHESTAYC